MSRSKSSESVIDNNDHVNLSNLVPILSQENYLKDKEEHNLLGVNFVLEVLTICLTIPQNILIPNLEDIKLLDLN